MICYKVTHKYKLQDHFECKDIGIYSSISNAENAIEILKIKEGFKEHTHKYRLYSLDNSNNHEDLKIIDNRDNKENQTIENNIGNNESEQPKEPNTQPEEQPQPSPQQPIPQEPTEETENEDKPIEECTETTCDNPTQNN